MVNSIAAHYDCSRNEALTKLYTVDIEENVAFMAFCHAYAYRLDITTGEQYNAIKVAKQAEEIGRRYNCNWREALEKLWMQNERNVAKHAHKIAKRYNWTYQETLERLWTQYNG